MRDTRDIHKPYETSFRLYIANINLNREKLKIIPLKSGTTLRLSLSWCILNVVLFFFLRGKRQLKETKVSEIRKEEVKVFLVANLKKDLS